MSTAAHSTTEIEKMLIFCFIWHVQWLRIGIKTVPEAMFSYTFWEYYATILYTMALSCIPIPN